MVKKSKKKTTKKNDEIDFEEIDDEYEDDDSDEYEDDTEEPIRKNYFDMPDTPDIVSTPGEKGDLVEKTSPVPMLNDLANQLAGKIKNEKGIWVYPKDVNGNDVIEPLINDMGIRKLMSMLYMRISKNTIFSKYSDHQIDRTMKILSRDLIFHLRYFIDDYQVKEGDLDMITDTILDSCEASLRRALNANEKGFIQETTQNTFTGRDGISDYNMRQIPQTGVVKGTINKIKSML